MALRRVRPHSPAHRPHGPDLDDHAGDASGGEHSCLAPPPDFLPGVADRVLELLPRALVTCLPVTPGLRLEGRPVAAGITRIAGELVAVAIARGPALVGVAP